MGKPLETTPFKVTETHTDRSATYDFLLVIQHNHGPISYRFQDKRRFRSKIANFPHHCVLNAPAGSSPCNFVGLTKEGLKNTQSCPTRQWKEFDDMCICLDTIQSVLDRQTDLP